MTKKNTPDERCACGHNESQHFDWKRDDGTPFGCVEGRGGLSVCDCKKFTPPAPPEERNQCDGCRRGMEKNDRNIHHDGEGRPYMVCTAARYPAPLADGGEILTRGDVALFLHRGRKVDRDAILAHDAALRAEVARLEQEKAAGQYEADLLRAEVERLREENTIQDGQISALVTGTHELQARAEKAEREREVHFEAAGALRTRLRECMDARDAAEARAEKAERERNAFMAERDDYVDGWAKQKALAEKLAAALREIVDQTERGYCAEPCSTHIARSALAENGEEK